VLYRSANFDAQLLYGRQLFIDGDRAGWRKLFEQLRHARVHSDSRRKMLYPLPQESRSVVDQIEIVYCWLLRDGPADRIYAHKNAFHETLFADLRVGKRVRFKIAFNMNGPSAPYVVDE
jgi:cold shock CspA family protein